MYKHPARIYHARAPLSSTSRSLSFVFFIILHAFFLADEHQHLVVRHDHGERDPLPGRGLLQAQDLHIQGDGVASYAHAHTHRI